MRSRISALRWALAAKIAPMAIQPVPPGVTIHLDVGAYSSMTTSDLLAWSAGRNWYVNR